MAAEEAEDEMTCKLLDLALFPFVILLLWLGDQWRWLQRIEDERWEE